MNAPVVTVITPTYNRAGLLGGAIETVLAQTSPDWEMIIINDGSKDETDAIVRPYRERDARIRYITQANAGVAAARNRALAEARGRYVAFLDDDDRWTPDKLEMQVAFMEAHPEIGLCYARQAAGSSPRSFPELLQPFESILPSTVMTRRDLLRAVGGFKTTLRIQEDYDCWLRFAQRWPIAPMDRSVTTALSIERSTLSSDLKRCHLVGIEVLKALQLTPENRRYRGPKTRHMGYLHYLLAREYYVEQRDWAAARHFFHALACDPLVGLRFRQPRDIRLRLLVRIAKSYAAIPACVVRGVLHAAR